MFQAWIPTQMWPEISVSRVPGGIYYCEALFGIIHQSSLEFKCSSLSTACMLNTVSKTSIVLCTYSDVA